MKQTHTLTLGGEEHDVDFEIEAYITYDPGCVSGPPEHCYPPEGECDITEIKVLTPIQGFDDEHVITALIAQREDAVFDELWEEYHSRGGDEDR